MIVPFDHIEILDPAIFTTTTAALKVTEDVTPKLILFRSLIGSIKIRHTVSDTVIEQNIDYLDPHGRNVNTDPLNRLKGYISEDISLQDLCAIFGNRRFAFQNHNFFERLTYEFNNYYYFESKGSHTTAFAFIYRILESVSYALPFIYAVKTNDFMGTYQLLKDYLTGNKDKGELSFFKSFIKSLFRNDPVSSPYASIQIDITAETEEIKRSYYVSFRKACSDEIFDLTATEEPSTISVKFQEFSSFIISLRNRFFHYFNSGQPNLESKDFLDSDGLFALINKKCAYWLAIVLFEILKNDIESQKLI